MVEHSLAKADTGVRFPSFAPVKSKSLYEKANGVNLRKFRLAPFFCFVQGDVFLFFIHKLSM